MIRVKVVCVLSHANQFLFIDGMDPAREQRFFIPVGGGLEFQEQTWEAAVREVSEEISIDIDTPELLGVTENIFEYDSRKHHEIIFAYHTTLEDSQRANIGEYGIEDNGNPLKLIWLDHGQVEQMAHLIKPTGLAAQILSLT